MEENTSKFILGIVLIVAAINLAKTPVYTSMKGAVLHIGGSIGLAVTVAIGLVFLTLLSGITVLRQL